MLLFPAPAHRFANRFVCGSATWTLPNTEVAAYIAPCLDAAEAVDVMAFFAVPHAVLASWAFDYILDADSAESAGR